MLFELTSKQETTIGLIFVASVLAIFIILFVKSCFTSATEIDEDIVLKVNNHDYADYKKAKSQYLSDVFNGVENSTIIVRDGDGELIYKGAASDYFNKIENNEPAR